MKTNIKAITFNGNTIQAEVDIFSAGLAINRNLNTTMDKNISLLAYAEAKNRLLNRLKAIYPDTQLDSISFRIASKDLENLKKAHIKPDYNNLALAIADLFILEIAKELKAYQGNKITECEKELKKKESDFRKYYLNVVDKAEINTDLQRVAELIKEKKYIEAMQLLHTITPDIDNLKDKDEAHLLQFILKLKSEKKNKKSLSDEFQKIAAAYSNKPEILTRFYFEYIRFLEDMREPRLPRELLKEFEEKYPVSILNNKDKSYYFYLKGRGEYLRGEYLVALTLLADALKIADKNDKEFIASVYNTAVNSFNDNLFFDEAEQIAQKAHQIRYLLHLPELQQTVSCIAGIKFKSTNYQAALELYQEAEKRSESYTLTQTEKNKLCNYIAKSAVMLDMYELAEEYLDKAEASGDAKGFSKKIRMLMLLRKKEYSRMHELYLKTFMLPENHSKDAYDSFALGWGYTFMAIASLEKQEHKDGVKYLLSAINFFLSDLYVLEAMYVSLYTYLYHLPETLMKTFSEIVTDFGLERKFAEFVEKHSIIGEKFFPLFTQEAETDPKKSALTSFYDTVKDINQYNFNPEEIKELLDTVCLV